MSGPAAGGALVAGAGPAAAMAVDSALTGISVLVLIRVVAPPFTRDTAGFWTDMAEGWAVIAGARWLRWTITA
ncbi:hypothetical protein [Actinomadura macrotermitis]|uniref:Uncharacterized protein n=1 Tax=Actinomadura macrotermitis TaxID=2585200 RepID=A0A7K0C2I9_9ACTN|nr:hypothetical protein [Actinomadura macrotermitis]